MKDLLAGKVVLVTGCDTGIGKAVCAKFAKEGATVYANILNPDSIHMLEQECEGLKGAVIPVPFDVTEKKSVIECIKQIKGEQNGRLDILVNNAGLKTDGLVEMVKDESIERMLNVNVVAVIHMTQSALKIMKRNPDGGVILNISSIVGVRGNTGQSVYGATKGAVAALTKSWAKELVPYNIRVNAVAPGSIDTNMFYDMNKENIQKSIDAIGMKRLGKPEEVANVLLFLASELASYVTGEIIGVDGGLYM